jgi:hypothetical protein
MFESNVAQATRKCLLWCTTRHQADDPGDDRHCGGGYHTIGLTADDRPFATPYLERMFGEAAEPLAAVIHGDDQEMLFTLAEAEALGNVLLELVRLGRQASWPGSKRMLGSGSV